MPSPFCKCFLVLILMGTLGFLPFSGTRAGTAKENLMSNALKAYDSGDYQNAYTYWLQAASLNNPTAMVALANMYVQGEGRPKNLRIAFDWYKQAALAGDETAQVNYAAFLEVGSGTQKDLISSYAWYRIAADQGNEWAQQSYQRLGNSFTARQRQQALVAYQTLSKAYK